MLTSIIPAQVTASGIMSNIDRKQGGAADLAKLGVISSTKTMSKAQMDTVAKDFESMFVSQMVESMFGESMGEEAFGTEETNDIYKGMMGQEYGKLISNSGGIGIADYVKRELLKLQEK
jgi:Rod binding domain-containing protein